MKTTINISIDADKKEQFTKLAKELGTNPTNLINMFIAHTNRSRRVEFGGLKLINSNNFPVEDATEEEVKAIKEYQRDKAAGNLKYVEATDEYLANLLN